MQFLKNCADRNPVSSGSKAHLPALMTRFIFSQDQKWIMEQDTVDRGIGRIKTYKNL